MADKEALFFSNHKYIYTETKIVFASTWHMSFIAWKVCTVWWLSRVYLPNVSFHKGPLLMLILGRFGPLCHVHTGTKMEAMLPTSSQCENQNQHQKLSLFLHFSKPFINFLIKPFGQIIYFSSWAFCGSCIWFQ